MAGNPDDGTTAAIDETFLTTTIVHNRMYQEYAITNLAYLTPMDQDEMHRLNLEHELFSRVFDHRLIFPPINRLRRVLDCGFGTAQWASAVAEENPGCEVIAVDINAAMAVEELPGNLYLQIDDLNRRFTFPAHNFDIVHSQMMATGIHVNRWAQYLRDMYHVTRGGGWVQLVELYYNVQSDNGSLSDDHALRQWSARYLESMEGLKDLRVPLRLPNLMRDAGFVDVEHRMIQLPTCGWSTERRDHDIGEANRENVQQMLSSLAIYPFAERLGMPIQDVHLLIAQARLEANDPALKAYFPLDDGQNLDDNYYPEEVETRIRRDLCSNRSQKLAHA